MLNRVCEVIGFEKNGAKRRDVEDWGEILGIGESIPSGGDSGWAEGALFMLKDGSSGRALYQNEGTNSSCNFKPIQSINTGMSPGTGITAGTGTQCKHSVSKIGDLYKTEIFVNIDGLQDPGTAGDIIGNDGTSKNCNIGQITAAVNGTVTAGKVSCLEVPATGGTDIDLYSADEATGSENDGISGLTNTTKLIDHGSWSAGDVDEIESMPSADQYLYLVAQSGGSDATYTTGILLIELYGV